MLVADRRAELDEGTEHFQPSTLQLTTIDVGNPATNVIPAEARGVVQHPLQRPAQRREPRALAARRPSMPSAARYELAVHISRRSLPDRRPGQDDRAARRRDRSSHRRERPSSPPPAARRMRASSARIARSPSSASLVADHAQDGRARARSPISTALTADLRGGARRLFRGLTCALLPPISTREIATALYGARGSPGDASGIDFFDDHAVEAFWRSFCGGDRRCPPAASVVLDLIADARDRRRGALRVTSWHRVRRLCDRLDAPFRSPCTTCAADRPRASTTSAYIAAYNWANDRCSSPLFMLLVLRSWRSRPSCRAGVAADRRAWRSASAPSSSIGWFIAGPRSGCSSARRASAIVALDFIITFFISAISRCC